MLWITSENQRQGAESTSGYTKLDFAMSVPQCSTPETKGVQTLESGETMDQRRDLGDRCLVYVPSATGQDLDPMVVTRDEARRIG